MAKTRSKNEVTSKNAATGIAGAAQPQVERGGKIGGGFGADAAPEQEVSQGERR